MRRCRDLGFSLEQVRALLALADQRERSCADVDALAREHLGEVERKIADLSSLARELRETINRCGHGTIPMPDYRGSFTKRRRPFGLRVAQPRGLSRHGPRLRRRVQAALRHEEHPLLSGLHSA